MAYIGEAPGFIFDPSKGQTPATLAAQRSVAQALVARSGTPHNVGEGLTAIGNALAYNAITDRADKAQAAGEASANDAFGPLMASMGGGGAGASPNIAAVAAALSNPFATDGQKAVGQALLARAMKPPSAPEGFTLGEGQSRYDAAGHVLASGPAKAMPRAATAEEKASFGLKPDTPLFIGADGTPHLLSQGGVTVNNAGSIPAGFKMNYDDQGRPVSMEALPGSPEDTKAKAAAAAADSAKAQTNVGAGLVVQDIDRALTNVTANPKTTSGVGGALLQGLPGTSAYDTAQLMGTIKANAAFDKLQAMRAASPTGGALGAVSDAEQKMLAAAIGNLELSQSAPQLMDNLRRVKNLYLDIIHGPGKGPPREPLTFENSTAARPPPTQVAPPAAPPANTLYPMTGSPGTPYTINPAGNPAGRMGVDPRVGQQPPVNQTDIDLLLKKYGQ